MGVDCVQGYLIGEPKPLESLAWGCRLKHLRRWSARQARFSAGLWGDESQNQGGDDWTTWMI